jgi:hypothetical protein
MSLTPKSPGTTLILRFSMVGPSCLTRPVFDVHYSGGRTALVLMADLDRGWEKLQKTYGFFHQTRIPYRNDLSIRAQLTVISQPAGFDESANTFPDIELEDGDSNLSFSLHNKQLVMTVALLPHQPWRTTEQGRPELFIERLPLCATPQRFYDLRAWIVFHEGSRRRIPDVHEWTENNLIVPGGQFESNRRRH